MYDSAPRISIVIPSFNQGEYLRDSIESVVNQSYVNKELIIIDGGSTDDSIDIIKQYERHIAYWISEKDRGQSHAIKKGFEKATGDWFNWINSDDALLPDALISISRAIKSNRYPDIIFGQGVYGNEKGTIIRAYTPLPQQLWIKRYFCLGNICQQATFFSRKAYESVNGVNPGIFYRMDTDLYERILQAGFKGITLDKPIGFFRVQQNSKTALYQGRRLDELRARDQAHGVYQAERRCVRILNELLSYCSGSSLKAYMRSRSFKGKTLHNVWLNS